VSPVLNLHPPVSWGQRLLQTLEQTLDPKRLQRGRQYIASHRVPDWTLDGNRIPFCGKNRGTAYYGMNEPIRFEGCITVETLPEPLWEEATRFMGNQAGFVARLLLNEIPDSIEIPLHRNGYSLLPGRYGEDIRAECSCRESDPPCRHIAAVLVALALRLDQTPHLLFELRGLCRSRLIEYLETTALGGILATALADDSVNPDPVDSYFTRPVRADANHPVVDTAAFWRAPRQWPAIPDTPQPAPIPGLVIKKGGDFPPFWQKDISFIEVMDDFYGEVRKKARDWS